MEQGSIVIDNVAMALDSRWRFAAQGRHIAAYDRGGVIGTVS